MYLQQKVIADLAGCISTTAIRVPRVVLEMSDPPAKGFPVRRCGIFMSGGAEL